MRVALRRVGTANVLLKFNKNDWQAEVAMAKDEELNEWKGFICCYMSWGILYAYAGKENSKDTDVVMTRNIVKERENEEKKR